LLGRDHDDAGQVEKARPSRASNPLQAREANPLGQIAHQNVVRGFWDDLSNLVLQARFRNGENEIPIDRGPKFI
jgi:hypothetical protein